VNDAERLACDPAMRWATGGHAVARRAASASQIGRFETEWLASGKNFAALTDLCGRWIDHVHGQRPPKAIVLDMDSSVSPTYGEQEGTSYNGHFGCTCYHPLFGSTSSAIWKAAHFDPATSIQPMAGTMSWSPWSRDIGSGTCAAISAPMPPSRTPRSTNSSK
jgi:hypothetical protein